MQYNAEVPQDTPYLKKLQVIYLEHYNFSRDRIKEITHYAKSTIRSYISQFSNLLSEALKTFYHIIAPAVDTFREKHQLVYLFKFYDKDERLLCSKIGTTTRTVEQRIKEEIRYYRKHNIPVESALICSVMDCGDIPAEGAESILRAHFIAQYPEHYCKNDRFFDINIDITEFNKVIKEYLPVSEE